MVSIHEDSMREQRTVRSRLLPATMEWAKDDTVLRSPYQAEPCTGCANTLTVSNRSSLPGRRALYMASRVIPESLATSVMPRERVISPIAAASNAGSFSSRTVVRYAATSSSLFRHSAASNSGSSDRRSSDHRLQSSISGGIISKWLDSRNS